MKYIFILLFLFFLNASLNAGEGETGYVIEYLGMGAGPKDVAHVPGFINIDGSSERYPRLEYPNQRSWIFGPVFSDGNRFVLTSYEDVTVKKVRTGQVITHNWIFNYKTGEISEILYKNRPADQVRAQVILPGEKRMVVSGIINGEEILFIMDLDGGNRQSLTREKEGFHYGVELSHDQKFLAMHVTGIGGVPYNPGNYSINVIELENLKRTLVAGESGHLFFGPKWSPHDQWLLYMDCIDQEHFRSALCIGKPDGSLHKVITSKKDHWFGTPYGSNLPEWSPDGKSVTYSRLSENSIHDMSQGSSQICLLHPENGKVIELTERKEGRWDYRAARSPEGTSLLFTRIESGNPRELWIMDSDGSNQRKLTDGYQDKGADFGRWFLIRD